MRIGNIIGRRGTVAGLVGAVVGLGAVVVPAGGAFAADSFDASQTVSFTCGGAKATVSVQWLGTTSAAVRWSLDDISADGYSPILRMQASNPAEDDVWYGFATGDTYRVNTEGADGGAISGGTDSWNPDGFGDFNNLEIQLRNGTDAQGHQCETKTVRMYNYGRLALRVANDQIGIPYVYGGASRSGFDCSGLIQYSFQHVDGFAQGDMPHQSYQQYLWAKSHGSKIATSDLQPGDVLFYDYTSGGDPVSHVAIYAGSGQMIEAPKPGTDVSKVSFRSASLVGAYRITSD
ncbi:C40 family peptidase [Luteimicrobium subarcticum]|uniref:NlpC/P60 family protein n=1 Tax=Luteimicrobium subarcticum TaxID=620910 RepID=A0A2M8WW87_9MICO|nr:C40 family peptidase [Luteimicrobium subarcticum]PJI95180.1 NlpC/P60 family protein [Luteimicrobium subarcticum]